MEDENDNVATEVEDKLPASGIPKYSGDYNMFKAKILLLGPTESGKTVLSNFLSDATETFGGDYHPTQGVRISEFEVGGIRTGSRTVKADIELWDCSGDHKFETCWPAIARDTNGVIFVFNPDQPNYDKELESWYNFFVEQEGLRENQCVVFAHSKGSESHGRDIQLPSVMSNISLIKTNLDDGADYVRDEFNNFVSQLVLAMTDKREQEELSIMNSR